MTPEIGPGTVLTRDCAAVTIPQGRSTTLPVGHRVEILQVLGGSVTVQTEIGQLFRVDGVDGDALGLEPTGPRTASSAAGPFDMDQVIQALQRVYDPEIPVSIVELGLVYACEEHTDPEGRRRIEIDMSMTAPGCGMGDILRSDAERAVRAVPGVDEVQVSLVWDPPWAIERMSDAARLQLGML